MSVTRYRTIKVNGKTKLLHRHVMEQLIGRALRRDEQVHHKNGDTRDNRIENLEVVAPLTHMRERHNRLKHPLTKHCVICGDEFTPHPTKRKRAKTCGKDACVRECISRTERATKARLVCPDNAAALVAANYRPSRARRDRAA